MVIEDIVYLLLEVLFGIAGLVMAIVSSRYLHSKNKLVYIIAPIGSVVFMGFTGVDVTFLLAYIASALLILGFFFEKKILRIVLSAFLIISMIAEFGICNSSASYRAADYVAEFNDAFEKMEDYYVLTDHKNIDFDDIYEKYLPLFKDANKRHDKVDCYIAWMKFCDEFKDGHVACAMPGLSKSEVNALYEKLYGYDFGFSLLRLEDDRVVAVNVDSESDAGKAGIVNGTVVLCWNGKPVEEMISEFDPPLDRNFPVKEAEDFIRPVFASGNCGGPLTIVYLDENKAEKEVTLSSNGIYKDRMEDTLSKLLDGTLETNLTVRQVDEKTAFIRIDAMGYDSKSYGSGEYDKMYEELRDKLQAQKDLGVTDLIIDLRANTGGDPGFDKTVFRLLFPEGEYIMSYNSVWDYDNNCFMKNADGTFVLGNPNKFYGEGFWGDGDITVIVSATTISAGDIFTEVISRLDNVKVIGITPSNCSGQAVRAVNTKDWMLTFSTVPDLNADGTIYIDPDGERKATIPLDIKVPVDDEFVDAVFNRGEDYLFDLALGM